MDLGLRGRKALVTGASKGIGRACAEVLAEEGCDVVLVSRTAADLEAVRAKIQAEHNLAVRYYALDLADSKNVDRLAADGVDGDFFNAGRDTERGGRRIRQRCFHEIAEDGR